jgi:hypothetical protein
VTRTLAEFVLLVALLFAAWLVVANSSRVRPPVVARPPAGAVDRDQPVGDGLPERAEALRAYLAAPPPPAPVRRNPFDFQQLERAVVDPGGRASAAGAAAAAPVPPRPDMELAGIAEDTGNGHPLRTAVISAAGQLILAMEGDRVLARFLVVRITADAVQLKDDEGGGSFSLVLK